MKKKVRVYKPGGEATQPTQEQIINYIAQKMSAVEFDGDTDTLKEELAQAGVPEDAADQYITYVSEELDLGNQDTTAEDEAAAAEEQARLEEEEQARLEEEAAAEEARQERLNKMYDTDMSDSESYMQYGGSKPSKKSFINKYTKLVKKQMGGNTPSPGADDVLNGRESHVKGFLGAVAKTAQDAQLREEAENQYNAIYGTPQMGAFQDGGIHQEEIDPENPLHHLSTYGADTRHIFSDDMYTQNDVAAMEQFGGNTGQGLYRFIGGGDNESADEMYQDADLDYNQYQRGGFRMPRLTGAQYVKAINSPYYTQTGERAEAPNLAGRNVTSVDVTKRGIFGRPKAYTVNYGIGKPSTYNKQAPVNLPPEEKVKRNQPIASWMMNSNIPGIRGIGTHLYKTTGYEGNNIAPTEQPVVTNIPEKQPDYLDPAKRKYLNQSLQVPEYYEDLKFPSNLTDVDYESVYEPGMPLNTAGPMVNETQDTIDAIKQLQDASKAYGGPVDYTQYAYGGDISIPELYRAVEGVQTFDPNNNKLGTRTDYKGDTYDYTGKLIKKRNTDFNLNAPEFKMPGTIDEDYKNPLTGEKPAIRMGSDGNYIDNTKDDGSYDSLSQDYEVKRDWDKTRNRFDTGMLAVNFGLDTIDQINANKQQNQMRPTVENLYGVNNTYDNGTYASNSGLFRPDKMGFNGVVKYGGGIYAMGGNTMDDEEDVQYMTQEEIDDFIANGGELEYL